MEEEHGSSLAGAMGELLHNMNHMGDGFMENQN
jgi:hypothetical protein